MLCCLCNPKGPCRGQEARKIAHWSALPMLLVWLTEPVAGQVTVPVGETTASAGSSRRPTPALVRLKSAYCLTVLCSASPGSQSTGTCPDSSNKGEQDTRNVPVSLTAVPACLNMAPAPRRAHSPSVGEEWTGHASRGICKRPQSSETI